MSVLPRALRPFVPSGSDYQLALSFFTEIGFKANWQNDGLAELQFGQACFLLQNFHHQEMQNNYMVYVEVPDLDVFWEMLAGKDLEKRFPGVRLKEPTLFPWGDREIHMIDPAGVCWHFGVADTPA